MRPKRFVTQKIVSAALQIAKGKLAKLQLGNISIQRDWGWAPEYVEAMYRMLQQDTADDYVIATGETHKLESFVAEVFKCFDLDWRDYVISDRSLLRPTDISISCGNPSKANTQLGWYAQYKMKDIARMMVEAVVSDKVDDQTGDQRVG